MAKDDTKLIDKLNNAVETITRQLTFSKLLGKTHGDKRDLYETFGYVKNPTSQDYYNMYCRNGIAKRCVDAYPNVCWSKPPVIVDNQETEDDSDFEKAVQELFKKLKVTQYLRRLDILQSLGEYAVLLLGGSPSLSSPAEPISELAYIMPYGQSSVSSVDSYKDFNSNKFGGPEKYSIEVGNELVGRSVITVHESHIIHVSENALDNDYIGIPMMKTILNFLYDLDKLTGSGPESFYLNARGGLHINSEHAINDPSTKENLKETIESFVHKLSRVMPTQNMEVKPLNYTMHSPKDHFDMIISCLSGSTGIPKAIVSGNEVGVRASSQDGGNFLSRAEERQNNFCEPVILRPFIDKCIDLGVLPEPKNGEYEVEWPPLVNNNELDKSQIALNKMNAANIYASGLASDIMPPEQAAEIIGFEYREDDAEGDNEDEDLNEEKALAASLNPKLNGEDDNEAE